MIAMTGGYEVGGDMRDDYRIYSYSADVIKVRRCLLNFHIRVLIELCTSTQ